jgi:glutaredoxin
MTLYTKPGCGLCDKAKSLLEAAGVTFTTRNVLEDEALREQYQYEIPVLVDSARREVLKGVFSESRVAALVARGVV